ncbi:MAG: MarR family winged helix-turn-helix transcriptional regulator [Rhodospirillaceae bacterium]
MTDAYDPKTFQPGKSLGYLVNRVRTELLSAIDQELAPLDVTSAQYIVMAQLSYSLADSASQLCKSISYDPGAMTRMIDRLEAKGFVRRVRCPGDRRASNLELTPEGQAVFPKMRDKVVSVLNRFLRGFTKAEVRELESLLQRVLDNA